MVKVLAVSASGRKIGNGNMLLKLALAGAQEQGAQVEQLQLQDYQLKPCTGCMVCILKERPCHLDDDMPQVLERLKEAQGLIIAAPTYVLGPAAVTKLLLDRFLMVARQVDSNGYKGTAATITTAGLPQWNALGDTINILPLAFQYRLVDYLVAYGPGPGEPLLQEGMDERARELGRRVAAGAQGQEVKRPPEPNQCPNCYGTTFKLDQRSQVACALCGVKATAIPGQQWELDFAPDWEGENRFAPQKLKHHVHDWIIGSKKRYMEKMPELMAKGIFSGKKG